jgi:hypothetical protein
MLNQNGYSSVVTILRVCCYLKFVPYSWNAKTHQLTIDATAGKKFYFYLNFAAEVLGGCFSVVRLIQTWHRHDAPFLTVMHIIYTLGYILGTICYVQTCWKKEQIVFYANSLLKLTKGKETVKILIPIFHDEA